MIEQPKLSAGRANALQVLAIEQMCRISNKTEQGPSGGQGSIYWQSATWLIDVGYGRQVGSNGIGITSLGIDRAVADGMLNAEVVE